MQEKRPAPGDYVQAPPSMGQGRYVIQAVNVEIMTAVSVGSRGSQATLSESWETLALAVFRLVRYGEIQRLLALTMMGAGAVVIFAVTGCWTPGAGTTAAVIGFTLVGAAAALGWQRDHSARAVALSRLSG